MGAGPRMDNTTEFARLASDPENADLIAASYGFVVASVVAAIDPSRQAQLAGLARQQLDPRALLRFARSHRIVPMVERAVVQCGLMLPTEVKASLAAEARKARIASFANAGEEVRLAGAAEMAGLDAIFLKGATLSHLLYADPSLKSSWDIDMLVNRADLRRGCELLRELGFIMDDPQGFGPGRQLDRWVDAARETAWHHPQRGTTVELHVGLSDTPALLRPVGMNSPRQCAMIGGVAVPTLADEHLFAYLCVHGSYHGWARLKWLADAAAMVGNGRHSIAEWRAIASENGAGRCGDVTLLLCHEVLGVDLPGTLIATMKGDAVTRSIVDYCIGQIQQNGLHGERAKPDSVPEILAYMRNLFRCGIGPVAAMQTAWELWNRPYGSGLFWAPRGLRPLAMLAWIPWRMMRRLFLQMRT